MAYIWYTKENVCEEPCQHKDCANIRKTVETICKYCGKPIGWDTKFCNDEDGSDVHWLCLLEAVDKERKT